MNFSESLEQIFQGNDLSEEDMTAVMRSVMTGNATDSQIGAFGGDSSHTFNVSTCSSIVAAAAGVTVAKHGNRSVSSKSGAADFLETAGVSLALTPEATARCIDEVGLGFMFAPNHHGAMRYAIGPRKELGTRSIFNLLGPMTNPAGVKRQILGVFAPNWVRPVAEAMKKLGSEHVLVVHGHDSMDEISLSGPSVISELKDGVVTDITVKPDDFGLSVQPLSAIQVDGAEASFAMIKGVLNNEPGAARDIVALNSGAAIYVAGLAQSIGEGVEIALKAIADGKALITLERLAALSQSLTKEA